MRTSAVLCFLAVVVGLCLANTVPASVIHSFAGGSGDGATPVGSVIESGSLLYGMTDAGGANSAGTIFQINPDGTGFHLLHTFTDHTNDGANPPGALYQSGSALYSATFGGGISNLGAVFKINTDGTGFGLLHSFTGGALDGSEPTGGLTEVGSTFFGETGQGGQHSDGTVYKINADGTGFQLLHSFAGGSSDGSDPYSSLIASGSTLYGTTFGGGSGNGGTVFKLNDDGTGYQILHNFTGASNDGSIGMGPLVQSGSVLYGMTFDGGANGDGTIYSLNTDGTNFQVLYSFNNLTNGGETPRNSLALSGSTLYGMERLSGADGEGSIFQINTDGSGFATLHTFTGGANDGAFPDGSLAFSGTSLVGMTTQGGVNSLGTIFSVVPEPASLGILAFGAVFFVRRQRSAPRVTSP